jgi:hypothetical protein
MMFANHSRTDNLEYRFIFKNLNGKMNINDNRIIIIKENKGILRCIYSLKNFILLVILLINVSAFSQKLPIHIVVSKNDTSSLFLSDLASFVSNKLSLLLYSNDINTTNYKVKLQIIIEKIENPTFQIKSTPWVNILNLTLESGVPIILDSTDLLPYINPDNLDFYGYDKNEFINCGYLPSGFYKFSFLVLDYYRDISMSNIASCYVRMIRSENDQGQIKNFELISNPVSDWMELIIRLNETAPVEIYLYRINAVTTSKKYRLTNLKEYNFWINVDDLVSGIYLVRITSKGQSKTKKILLLTST